MTLMSDAADCYKDAVIYQIHVRSFYDSNNDGIGDFKGLIQKLDYIEFLGVNTIWLLPFYPSPLKDEGYDIADYMNINPLYGTLDDFKKLLEEAHQRNIKVITELVINHTSNQHEWFKKSRMAAPGSPWRNYYVWSDTAEEFSEARVIFRDFETSNWTWDSTANAYYWHRFYSHQPDLNYDNPEVQNEIFRIVDFWLDIGVDGLRLDAIPYLFQREGTNCENLPETHQFLKKLNHHVTSKYKNRFLLAEANQWPEDAVAYFGDGDECHMAFHFPLMPRMYMAIRLEDRYPILDIIDQTPAIPPSCQWAIFLRNHDELTLEMVTDEERDYMYRMYGQDQQMRINLGIRRRLTPLMEGDRRKIELLNVLLFSMPGTPVIYYGDEIGMGDNCYLGDRNGVRTPMQWSNDSNAGFSQCNPQKLYLPVIIDPEYSYQAINVKLQENNPQSMLWWMKRLIEVRSKYPALSRGSIEFLYSANHKVLAFYRIYEGQTVLILLNLSHHNQNFFLDLSPFIHHSLEDVFGKTLFPLITEAPYLFMLSPHGFLWLEISKKRVINPLKVPEKRVLTVEQLWSEVLTNSSRKEMESILADYIPGCRWYRSKNSHLAKLKIIDFILMKKGQNPIYLVFIEVDFYDRLSEKYCLFLTSEAEKKENLDESKCICLIKDNKERTFYLIDAIHSVSAWNEMYHLFCINNTISGLQGELWIVAQKEWQRAENPIVKPLNVEQSNTSIVYDRTAILKHFRLCEEGVNPEVEICDFLKHKSVNIPQLYTALHYINSQKIFTVGIIQEYIDNEEDAWNHSLNVISNLIEQYPSAPSYRKEPLTYPWNKLVSFIPEPVKQNLGFYVNTVQLLAERTAQMHLALAGDAFDRGFETENFTLFDQRSLYQSLRNRIVTTAKLFETKNIHLQEDIQAKVSLSLKNPKCLLEKIKPILTHKIEGKKIRCHGDYHLGQILYTGNDFIIIDFEGEPARPLSERKIKRPPLRDVAGILRSFHYVLYTALNEKLLVAPNFDPEEWYSWICHLFINSYLSYSGIDVLVPNDPVCFSLLLQAYMLEKVLYEINYELNNRPDWIHVPCLGLINLLGLNS